MVIEDSNKMVKGLQDIIKSKKSNKQEKEKTSALIDSGYKDPEEQCAENEARESRGHWKHPLDFLFSCISVSVGLGNIWRFPYLCYKNGGGVFLIIYFISMLFCGIPVFLLEVSIGQYLGAGGMTTISQICPILKGMDIRYTFFVKSQHS